MDVYTTEIPFNFSPEKLKNIYVNAPVGLLEITYDGDIMNANRKGNEFYLQLQKAYHCDSNCIFDLFYSMDPKIVAAINNHNRTGNMVPFYKNDIVFAKEQRETETEEICFSIMLTARGDSIVDSIWVNIEDSSDKYQREKAMQKSEMEKAIAQGKYEIASEVLHDIGNAVVGFGAYLNKANRILDKTKVDNLQNVSTFLKNVQPQLADSLGADKAAALVTLMEGIVKSEKESKEELRKSVTEQLHIISHIQEILTIQRQYVVGHEAHERKPVKLKQVIDDCMSMLFASFDKKNIQVNIHLDSDCIPVVKGDRTKLMQVILNLLKNSVEAIDTEAPVKKIDIRLQSNGNITELEIKDTGKGFDAGIASSFFQRGYTTKSTGTGLGLYNCKQIIEAHAGTIQINSSGPGTGAVTNICFQQ